MRISGFSVKNARSSKAMADIVTDPGVATPIRQEERFRDPYSTPILAAALAVPAAAGAQGVNDAQIASIVVTANQVDIDAGKLAASRASA